MRLYGYLALALAALCVSADPTDPPAKAAPNVTVTEVRAPHGLRVPPPQPRAVAHTC